MGFWEENWRIENMSKHNKSLNFAWDTYSSGQCVLIDSV